MKRYLIYIVFAALLATLLVGCTARPKSSEPTIYVTIAPLKGLVKALVGEDFRVEMLLPSGASPESYEPSVRQYIAVNEADMVVSTGLIPFEQKLLRQIDKPQRIVELKQGIDLMAGSCSHPHHAHEGHAAHNHAHGTDPHIWTSPRALMQMSERLHEALLAHYPDSTHYTQNFNDLQSRIEALDQHIEERIAASGIKTFVIYHPALTYYARDYGLRQIAIEHEGKEPQARRIAELIQTARHEEIRTILVQQQFPTSSVEIIAEDTQATVAVIDPLAEDILAEIERITDLITRK
ncbi:MAG: zinc ABC transporter substrate-binding protein [Rikenellaceae bacterium]|nr:zinc ABC transporter substrate-binding protein [Rikenellaceae bacterium]